MYVGDVKVTKREVLVSVSIVAILMAIGVWVSGLLMQAKLDRDEVYNKAVKLDNRGMFEYGMRTNVGNAFVYGDYCAVDTVTYPEIGGEYMMVKKIKERYTRHTRTVTKTRTVNGKTQTYTETEVYWTWDEIDRESKSCSEVTFLGVSFGVGKIEVPSSGYITTIKESSKIRYKYYGVAKEHIGTIYTCLKDGTISDKTPFYEGRNAQETAEYLTSGNPTAVFWFFWVMLICGCVWCFCYLDNRWIE